MHSLVSAGRYLPRRSSRQGAACRTHSVGARSPRPACAPMHMPHPPTHNIRTYSMHPCLPPGSGTAPPGRAGGRLVRGVGRNASVRVGGGLSAETDGASAAGSGGSTTTSPIRAAPSDEQSAHRAAGRRSSRPPRHPWLYAASRPARTKGRRLTLHGAQRAGERCAVTAGRLHQSGASRAARASVSTSSAARSASSSGRRAITVGTISSRRPEAGTVIGASCTW